MSSLAYERVHHNLKRLKLTTIDALLDNYLEIAAKEEQSTLEVLDYLFDQELKSKEDRALGLRMRMAGFPMEKRLEDFDMSFQPSLDPVVIRDLASLRVHPQCRECSLPWASWCGKDPSRPCSWL